MNRERFKFRSPQTSAEAFSLVEIALSLGIVSFAFVGIFSLLPAGMTSFRQAIDTTMMSQIVQRVANEEQQTDFATLTGGQTQRNRYFDDQGNEVPEAGASVYSVEITVAGQTPLPNGAPSPNLATVTIRTAWNPGHNPSPFDAGSNLPISSHVVFIANNQ